MANHSPNQSHESGRLQRRKAWLRRTQKPRTCLKCGRVFDRDGPWNRVCQRCKWNGVANTCDELAKDGFLPAIHKVDPAMKATLRAIAAGITGARAPRQLRSAMQAGNKGFDNRLPICRILTA